MLIKTKKVRTGIFNAMDLLQDFNLKSLMHLWEAVPNGGVFTQRCFAMDMRRIENEFDIASRNIMIYIIMKPTDPRQRNFLLKAYETGDHFLGGVLDMAEAKVSLISSEPFTIKMLKLKIEVDRETYPLLM